MFFLRLEELIYVLKENYASYHVKLERPAQEPSGGYSEDSLTKAINQNVDNFANFMFTQMFKAELQMLAAISQGSNKVDGRRSLQNLLHRSQVGDGQKIDSSRCHHQGAGQLSQRSTRCRGFQATTEAAKQRTTVKLQQGQQSFKGSKLQVQLQWQQPAKLQPVQSAQIQCFQKW